MSALTDEQIAKICHEANRAYQAVLLTPGIPVAPCWEDFPADQQAGVVAGVQAARKGGRMPEDLHYLWWSDKVKDGWTYGAVKDAEAKTHPCMLPYSQLPDDQKVKDEMFVAIIRALSGSGAPLQVQF